MADVVNRRAVTRELPNNIPYPAKRSLIQDFQNSWGTHMMRCFERVQANFKNVLGELIRERFERFHHLKGIVRCVASYRCCGAY